MPGTPKAQPHQSGRSSRLLDRGPILEPGESTKHAGSATCQLLPDRRKS